MRISFNEPHLTGREAEFIADAIARGKLSASGYYSECCSRYFEQEYGFCRALMTTSCTSALEMAALLCQIKPGDEVIMPSFTFVSTALAFAKFGAKIRFVDSLPNHPNMDCSLIEKLITPQTQAIVAVHYNGVSCDMKKICELAQKYDLMVIEDIAHTVNSIDCGTLGDLVTMSFHETKSIHCGEGGLLGINNEKLIVRAEKLWMKGTNRLDFEKEQTEKYEWVDTGGAYAMSELSAAFLWGQITEFDEIISRREAQWSRYKNNLKGVGINMPSQPGSNHIFYLVLDSKIQRDSLITNLVARSICAPFHYQSLHNSPYGRKLECDVTLPNAERFSDCLVRLPLYYGLKNNEIDIISDLVKKWFTYTY